uniref:Uncharacterized protein n=1 Tax=Meloidogyne enterolobii TaxID=390850 RepID=A0A6V7W4Z2_MELEN|nr:unnamed protein product [Meloidogyne enterolobii]
MSGVFKTSSPADNNNKKQQHKLQEIQSRIRVQQSQQQQNNRIPSPPFYSSAPSFSNNNCIQKQRIEFNHVDNIQNIVKTSEDKNSSNDKNWAAKTSLLNRLRLKSASFEGRKCNNGGNDKEKIEINGTKEQTEINKNNCILLADEAFTKASSSISISNPVGALSTTDQNNFNHSLSALNSTSTSGALNKQRSPSPPPSVFANTDNCIKQEFDPELSASLFEQSRTLCDNKTTSNSLTNTLTEPSQSINTEKPHLSSFPNSFVDSLEVNTPNTLIEEKDKFEQQNLPSLPSTSAASQQQQKSPSLEPFAVPALPTPKQKAAPLSFSRQEEPKLLKKEQEEIQVEQTHSIEQQETDCSSAASTSLKTEQPKVSQVQRVSINNDKQDLKQQLSTTYFQNNQFDETEATSSSKTESFEVSLDNKEKVKPLPDLVKTTKTSEVLAKSKRLSLRVSSAAALQFNRLAFHHSKALNTIGINSIQLKSSLNCLSPIIQLVDRRASFDYISQRRERLNSLRQQKQELIQLIHNRQLKAVAALQQRNSQGHQILPGKAAAPNVAAASMSSVAQTSKKRLVPVPAESSPHLNSQHHVQRQHNSSSSSSNSTTPQQRTPPSHPYCPVQPSFSSPSSTSILQQQNEHQQHSVPNKNKNNDSPYLMHSAPIPQQQQSINAQNQTMASSGVAENSPLLVNLLNNNASSSAIQQTQKPQQIIQQNVTPLPQQQQMMMIKQQQMAALQQQHSNAMGQAHQVNSQQYGVPMNPQQHQQMYQQQQQRLAQQQSMIYGVGPSGVINNTPQQHYMIVGSPPTGSSPAQYHRQTTHYGANGQPVPGGIVASPPGAPSPYFGMPPNYVPQQMIIPTTGADKQGSSSQMFSVGPTINNTQLAVEELPKKRKRISKKQQQKEEREREQRLRLQEQQQQAAMAAFRQHQQMAFMQQQQQQRLAAVNAGIPQQMCGDMGPSNMQNCQVPAGQVIAAQQHYQQQQQMYQQHYLGLPGQPAIQKQDTNVIQNNMTPSICPYGTPQKGSPMQPSGAPMSQQQQYVVALQQQQHGQQTLQNQCYVSPQQQAPWANTPNQMSHNQCGMQQQQQNALNDYQSTAAITNQSQQQHPQQSIQSQQAFRTPGTPHYFSQSPASATPFYSPPPSHNQQMVGTPIGNGSGGGTCVGMQGSGPGHLTPVSATAGGPTPPHSAGSFGNPQHQHSSTPVLDTNVEPTKQQNTIDQTISSQNRHLMQQQQMMAHMQQSSPHANHVEFYQQRFQHQRQQTMENITQQTPQNSLQQQPRNFSQLSDFAESGFGDTNDLSVPGILGEGIDDLDSIEPMRYGGEHQNHNNLDQRQQHQQQLVLQQSDDSNQQQNLSNNFYRHHPLVQQQGQQQQLPKQVVKRQLLNSDQGGQQCKKQKRKYSIHQLQNGVEDERKMLEMTLEQRNVAEMALLPDRSPQIGDTPLSPSKLSETQDRNVSDAIATVMERVAKNGPGQNFSSKASNF